MYFLSVVAVHITLVILYSKSLKQPLYTQIQKSSFWDNCFSFYPFLQPFNVILTKFSLLSMKLIKLIFIQIILLPPYLPIPLAYSLYLESTSIFNQVSVPLVQWATNNFTLQSHFPADISIYKPILKVLGVFWNKDLDTPSTTSDIPL